MPAEHHQRQRNQNDHFSTCNPALATLVGIDALVARALDGQIQLYRLNRATGEQKAVRLVLLERQRGYPAALFLIMRRNGALLLGESRLGDDVAGNSS